MPKKRWHVCILQDAGEKLSVHVTNEPDNLRPAPSYREACRDRTEALKRRRALTELGTGGMRVLMRERISVSSSPPRLATKLFQIVNEGFTCAHCGASVEPTAHDGPRNHCPFCLYSIHVDINPGDRANRCRGLLTPVGVETSGKKGFVIMYRCESCGETTRAKAASKSTVQPDNFEVIVALSQKMMRGK
jgi:hypothetical protein